MFDGKDQIAIGGLRILTTGEINLARTLYGSTIRYNEVWVHRGSYLPFNMQRYDTAMTPNGEMYFMEGTYEPDFSAPHRVMMQVDGQHIFLHEMMHVWQHQHGMYVRTRGAFSWAADYTYDLDKVSLFDYGLEQQASIVSDYWLLKTYSFERHEYLCNLRNYDQKETSTNLIARYKKVMGRFPL